MPKGQRQCQSCGNYKHISQYPREDGKLGIDCKECVNLKKAGLNPAPELVKPPDFDADLARRKQQYRNSIQRLKGGLAN